MTLILGIETSCDETAASIVRDGTAVLCNVVSSQNELHQKYHGVVPEIASRAHLERILPVVNEALARAGVTFEQIDAVAVGNRPGLIGSLLVGVSAAKAIAWAAGKPLIGVDHIQAHLHAAALFEPASGNAPGAPKAELPFPALGLVVSGGHSSLYAVESPTRMQLLGKTIDDAVGEAYDKAAVILDAGYPGGPKLDKLAQTGDPKAYDLPRSLLGPESLDFSFSGLKTALLYKVRGLPVGRGEKAAFSRTAADLSAKEKADLAAAFQHAAVETVIAKLARGLDFLAAQGKPAQSLLIGGGVSANSLLRVRVQELGQQRGIAVGVPKMAYCLDNAAMIAGLAYYQLREGRSDDLELPAIATTSM